MKCSSQAGRPSGGSDKALDTHSAYQNLLSSQNTGRALRTAPLTCPGFPQQLVTPEEKGSSQVNGYSFGAFCPAWLPPLCSARAPRDCQEHPKPSVPRFPLPSSLLVKQHFFLALSKGSSVGETPEGLLDQKVMATKRAKGDAPQSHVLGGAGVAVGLEVTVPVLCPGTHSMLGTMPGRHLRFSPWCCWCLWWVEGAACAAGTCHLPAVPGVPGYSWSNTFCRSL